MAKQKESKRRRVVVAVEKAVKRVSRKVGKAVDALVPTSGDVNLPGVSEAAILDSLAALVRRVDNFVQFGPSYDPYFEGRIRARLDTPGLREWVTKRLEG